MNKPRAVFRGLEFERLFVGVFAVSEVFKSDAHKHHFLAIFKEYSDVPIFTKGNSGVARGIFFDTFFMCLCFAVVVASKEVTTDQSLGGAQ